MLPPKGRYRHFKGGEYELLHIARHSETGEPMAVYRALYPGGETPDGEGVWVRPLAMWTETVDAGGARAPRFAYLGEEAEEETGERERLSSGGAPSELGPGGAVLSGGRGREPADGPERMGNFPTGAPEPTDLPGAAAPARLSGDLPPWEEAPPPEAPPAPPDARSMAASARLSGDLPLWEETPSLPARALPPRGFDAPLEAPEAVLKRVFGYDAFREGQRTLIEAILDGRDALGVMPTGAGKSICYQVPALALPGCALVISPLISLMKDQVAALKQAGVAAAYINSSLSERQMDAALSNAAGGAYRIIYVAPERLRTPRFLRLCGAMKISLVAVDEAHCISQWGQDFRPSYLEIPEFIAELPARPRLCAFTATATRRVREDIARLMRLKDPFVLVTGFDRPNLRFTVERPRRRSEVLARVLERHEGHSGIVYCATRKTVEQVCQELRARGVSATRYHAGLSDAERQANQEDFSYDRARVMVATNAFGMGIDKADVRFVVHYNMPKDLESYYQEAGRAGRDGEAAECVLLFGKADVITQRYFIDRMGEEAELEGEALSQAKRFAWERLERMTAYCQTDRCLRAHILRYFGEEAPERCDGCGNCLRPAELVDARAQAIPVLECVREINGRVGAGLICRVLAGSGDKRVRETRLDRSRYYGALKGVPRARLADMIDQMIEREYLASSGGKYAVVRLGPRAEEALAGGGVLLRVPEEQPKPVSGPRKPAGAAVNADLFELLRAKRTRIAESRGVPAYMIFPDATLRAICALLPATPEELLRVPGVGDAKLRAYGEEFLRVVARWQARN